MRRVRYEVAMSLDGYIAGPNDETDWMLFDPEGGFFDFFTEFDTFLLGRRTYELLKKMDPRVPLVNTYVFSRTLQPEDHPGVTIVPDLVEDVVTILREQKSDKDIWIYGGGGLFRTLLDAGLVDALGVAIIPVLLGGGVPLLPPPAKQVTLKLIGHKVLKTTGTVSLSYVILNGAPPDPSIAGKEKLGKVLPGRSWGKAGATPAR